MCDEPIEPGDAYELTVWPPNRNEYGPPDRWLTWRSHYPRTDGSGGRQAHRLGCAIAAAYRENAEREQKRLDDYAAAAVTKYKETNPSVAGHPELNGGVPSGYPNIPKPRDTKSVREFSSMSVREKIASAMIRANEFGKSTSGAV